MFAVSTAACLVKEAALERSMWFSGSREEGKFDEMLNIVYTQLFILIHSKLLGLYIKKRDFCLQVFKLFTHTHVLFKLC